MDLSEKQLIESVFAGGGDMGARMRAFDWSATDLGPVAQWPQSLRACVRIVLGAGHPMLISWGPNYTMLYNDAYGSSSAPSTLARWVAVVGRCLPKRGISSGHASIACTRRDSPLAR